MYKDNLEYQLMQLKPSEFIKMLEGLKNKDIIGYPMCFCMFPMPQDENITFKIKD